MSPRRRAIVLYLIGFTGFFALMGAWVSYGGNSGGPALVGAAFLWMFLVVVWLEIALRCPHCKRRIFSGFDVPWPIPAKCSQCRRHFERAPSSQNRSER